MASCELLAPVAVGVKVTLMVQLDPAATELPQLLVWANSPLFPPVKLIAVIPNGAVPVFESVTAWGLLVVPTVCELKFRELGDKPMVVGNSTLATKASASPPPKVLWNAFCTGKLVDRV